MSLPIRSVTVQIEPDLAAWNRAVERLAKLLAEPSRRPFGMHTIVSTWAEGLLRKREQERREAAALARRAEELSETTGAHITAGDLRRLACSMGGPIQGIRYGQPWQALVPPHARHLITDRSTR